MKKRTLFILVGILILALLISLIWWLSVREVKINDNHVGINFEIHNCLAVEKDQKLMHEKFLKPLLQFFMVEESNGREQLFIPKITCNEVSFCIPVFGMNSLRYKNDASNINETTITSTSRKDDEETFFSKWTAEGFNDLETILSKGNAKNLKNQNLPSLSTIRLKDASDDIIQDSIIIDKSCIAEQSPYLFNSAENARKYINSVLSKNPNALIKGTKNKTIHLFIWCGNGYLLNTNDIDNDGVSNEKDSCPNVPGEKSNNGCPKKVDSDGDGFNDDVDQCKDIPGECDGCECKPPPPGCPDKDHDGICDSDDQCPRSYGFKRYGGCPVPDTDKDGVNDEKDQCRYEPGPISNKGCPVSIMVDINKMNGTSNYIKFSSPNYTFKDNDDIRVVIYHNGKSVGQPKKLAPSEIRGKLFKISGPELKEQIGSEKDKLFIQLEFILNNKPIRNRSERMSIYCNL
jgi:hypothetical protein